MKGSMTAAAVHKQYEEGISALRRQIGDGALRQRFAAEADAFFRACALGVWGRDGNALTPATWSTTTRCTPRGIRCPPFCSGSCPPR